MIRTPWVHTRDHADVPLQPDLPLSGRRILFVVPPRRFHEGQLYQAWQLLADEGAWLSLATDAETGIAVGEGGAKERATANIDDIRAREFDAVVLIGSRGGDGWHCDALAALLERARNRGVLVAAFREALPADAAFGEEEVLLGTLPTLPRFLAELVVRLRSRPTPSAPAPSAPAPDNQSP